MYAFMKSMEYLVHQVNNLLFPILPFPKQKIPIRTLCVTLYLMAILKKIPVPPELPQNATFKSCGFQ